MKFMLLFSGGDPDRTVSARESDMKADQMNRWRKWITGLAKDGVLESASPFPDAGNVVSQQGVVEFVKHPGDLAGYAIVSVPSEKEAVEIAGSAPHVVFGGTTVVRPCITIPG